MDDNGSESAAPEPEEQAPSPEVGILDEALGFVTRHMYLSSENQAVAMVLYAAATHALNVFPAFGRMLFTSDKPESGKTTAMDITAALSSNPQSAEATSDGLASILDAATNTPEVGAPTLTWDEIEKFYGNAGLNRPVHLFNDVALKGYKRGKTRTRSVSRSPKTFSIYAPVLMTGLQTAVPGDLRTRCIVIHCEPGTAPEYFDIREAQPLAERYGRDLGLAVKNVITDLALFRAKGVAGLTRRRLEVWEPLFAIAVHLGGQKWLNKCMAAFTELALGASNQIVLTARQQLIRDAAAIIGEGGALEEQGAAGFIPAEMLAAELKRADDDLYRNFSENSLLQFIAANMEPLPKRQVAGLAKYGCYPLPRMMGYFARDIRAEWDRIRPDDLADVEIPEAVSPFRLADVDDGDLADLLQGAQEVQGGLSVGGVRGVTAGPFPLT